MHEHLATAARHLGIGLPRLERAAADTERIVEEARSYLTNRCQEVESGSDAQIDVVVFGSLARGEASPRSDFDFLVIVHELCEHPETTRNQLRVIEEYLAEANLAKPGASGMFGKVVSAADVTERIGLEADTNLSHSRRTLLVTESRSVLRPELHTRFLKAILGRYLLDYATRPKHGPPRFLINDVTRYWRTIAVDYQAKRWEDHAATGWGMRYLKLILSRKLAYAGALVPLLLCQEATVEALHDGFAPPPLARLAALALHDDFEGAADLAEVLTIADWFVGCLADRDFRERAKAIESRGELDQDAQMRHALDRARALQTHLENIFFGSAALAGASRRYLSF